jgi:holin-like protein
MFASITVLLACQIAGEWLAQALGLAIPGPVLGMALLATALAVARRVPHTLGRVSDELLKAMPLFFVPAGVGVLTLADTLESTWPAVVVALLTSTIVAIAITGLAMRGVQRLLAPRARFRKAAP